MKTTQTVEALLRPVVTGMGYELDEVEFQKEQGNWVLTLYIEHQDGRSATIDDCEAVSRAVDPILDEARPNRAGILSQCVLNRHRAGRSKRIGTISAASAAPLQ